MLRTSRNDYHVALAADPLFGAQAEVHLALEHPHDLFIWVTVRLDMDTGPDAPPHNHPLVAGKDAGAVDQYGHRQISGPRHFIRRCSPRADEAIE
jgi:hypothetical protein